MNSVSKLADDMETLRASAPVTPVASHLDEPVEMAPLKAHQAERARDSLSDLVRQLSSGTTELVSKQVELVQAEIRLASKHLKQSISQSVASLVCLIVGFAFLMVAAHQGLSLLIPEWASALIIGGVLALIGLVLFKGAQKFGEKSLNDVKRTVSTSSEQVE